MDTVDAATRSKIMSRVRSKDTRPEKYVRSLLHRSGFRFRLHRRDLPGRPDLILPKHGFAVFVHGCFWHRHDCKRFRWPKSNAEYWRNKIRRNVERDRQAERDLKQAGWSVHKIWTCDLDGGVNRLIEQLRKG